MSSTPRTLAGNGLQISRNLPCADLDCLTDRKGAWSADYGKCIDEFFKQVVSGDLKSVCLYSVKSV